MGDDDGSTAKEKNNVEEVDKPPPPILITNNDAAGQFHDVAIFFDKMALPQHDPTRTTEQQMKDWKKNKRSFLLLPKMEAKLQKQILAIAADDRLKTTVSKVMHNHFCRNGNVVVRRNNN